nr:YraN family protein [Prevotella sp.]
MAEHNDLGKLGEEKAAVYLREKGYTIIERDWKFGKRDLDIIALDDTEAVMVFVEVKTRRNENYIEPEMAIDRTKIRNLASCANAYVRMNNVSRELRFDIITVIGEDKDDLKVEHIVDAFNPLLIR